MTTSWERPCSGSPSIRRDDAVRIHSYDRVPNGPGSEEVYQLVSFRVRSDNSDHWSDWTRWEKSDVARIH